MAKRDALDDAAHDAREVRQERPHEHGAAHACGGVGLGHLEEGLLQGEAAAAERQESRRSARIEADAADIVDDGARIKVARPPLVHVVRLDDRRDVFLTEERLDQTRAVFA